MCKNKTIAQLNFRPIALDLTTLGSTLQHFITICHSVSNKFSSGNARNMLPLSLYWWPVKLPTRLSSAHKTFLGPLQRNYKFIYSTHSAPGGGGGGGGGVAGIPSRLDWTCRGSCTDRDDKVSTSVSAIASPTFSAPKFLTSSVCSGSDSEARGPCLAAAWSTRSCIADVEGDVASCNVDGSTCPTAHKIFSPTNLNGLSSILYTRVIS